MKVIKKGRKQQGWSAEITCTGKGNGNGGCEAILQVSEGDLYQTTSNCRDETNYYITFRCPCCTVETDIDNVPNRIWTIAKNNKRK